MILKYRQREREGVYDKNASTPFYLRMEMKNLILIERGETNLFFFIFV